MRKLFLRLLVACLLAIVCVPSRSAHAESEEGGDMTAGRRHYALCSACHGPGAFGNRSLDAPALAGREEWYLRRQLEAFRSGIRGGHADDRLGQQMRAMALTLPNEQAVRDVAAYLSSLDLQKSERSKEESSQ